MKYIINKIYIILFLLAILLIESKALAKKSEIKYTKENISHYFSGIISANRDYNTEQAFKHLKKVQSLKNVHSNFNIEFLRTLVLLEKFNESFSFSKSIWNKEKFVFEADLLLGIEAFIKKDYSSAEKYFLRINEISPYNFYFENFLSSNLLAWTKAVNNNKQASFELLENIPKPYHHLKKTQKVFLQCYFEDDKTQLSFKELIENKNYNFSRYNFFFANYFIFKNENGAAKKVIENGRKKYNSNLLLRQTEEFLAKNNIKEIKKLYNCKNPEDSLAELFYIVANLYSSEKDYKLSNFYLKISLFLNSNFLPNKALLAENLYFQKKNTLSKKVYKSLKSIGSTYSWYADKSISNILLMEEGFERAASNLEKEFSLISNPNYEHHYELANFYKRNEFYEKSIKYYSLALNEINRDNSLYPKILDRRGTSYERIDKWKKAEKDLMESLELSPDQPHVLNYLAYSWIDKGINLDKGLEMLKKATQLKQNDGYIIDSLGWAYYAKKNYAEAEKFLQRAVQILPQDPIINDHYADSLWMLNKEIQARYFWNYVLNLSETEEELKEKINKKLIFGIVKKL